MNANELETIIERVRRNDPTLVRLDLRGKIGVAGAQALADALRTNTTLTQLDLRSSNIGVDLSSNLISAAGAQALADALRTHATLTKLNLSSNYLGDINTQPFADALKTNTTLTELDLISNYIGDVGAQALADALRTNTTLTRLNLAWNQIDDAGAQALANALRTNATLTFIDLYNNQIGPAGMRALARVQARAEANAKPNQRTLDIFSLTIRSFLDKERTAVRRKYANARAAAEEYRRLGLNKLLPDKVKDTIIKAADYIWATRDEDVWLFDPTERDARGVPSGRKKARTNACIGCFIGESAFHEQHDESRRFCSSYCQFIHYHNLPDVRGMTPAQIRRCMEKAQ
jgi:ubiquinone biosynthesis protein UbiJ